MISRTSQHALLRGIEAVLQLEQGEILAEPMCALALGRSAPRMGSPASMRESTACTPWITSARTSSTGLASRWIDPARAWRTNWSTIKRILS
jgi:hypothetical protein